MLADSPFWERLKVSGLALSVPAALVVASQLLEANARAVRLGCYRALHPAVPGAYITGFNRLTGSIATGYTST